ncbi:MAG: protein-L-isoaspartate(D-aspartate) O-methyltransferase [Anaerolineae bacterium]
MTRITGLLSRQLATSLAWRAADSFVGWLAIAAGLLVLVLGIACRPRPAAGSPTPPITTVQLEPTATTASAGDPFANQRRQMVYRQIAARGIRDPRVLQAMRTVPRHKFIPQDLIDQAYEDHPVPIGYGQTISQPYIVALMTEKLDIEPGDKVLEIGTGSGYQAGVLAELTDQVFSVEIIPQLAARAFTTLQETGYTAVKVLNADGYHGWAEHAPYEAIIVTAAPDHVPHPLIQQLKDGGRLVIPIGPPGGYQTLWQITRHGDKLQTENLGGVRFVPFTGAGVSGAGSEQ